MWGDVSGGKIPQTVFNFLTAAEFHPTDGKLQRQRVGVEFYLEKAMF